MPEIVILIDSMENGREYIYLLSMLKIPLGNLRTGHEEWTTSVHSTKGKMRSQTIFADLITDSGMEDTMVAGEDDGT